jgi:L-fuconolactonase
VLPEHFWNFALTGLESNASKRNRRYSSNPALPNVVCKMSGLVTEADMENWTPDDLRPYIDHVVECFGFDRIIFGGDWPVAAQATKYPRWVSTLDHALSGCSDEELRKVYVTNAEAFYRV